MQNLKQSKIPFTSIIKKNKQKTYAGQTMKKLEPFYTVGGEMKRYSHNNFKKKENFQKRKNRIIL